MISIIVSIASIVGAVLLLLLMGYVKAPTDKAYIISGIRKEPRVLIGRAGIKIPFLERKDELILKQMSVDIKTNGFIPTNDFIGVDIDAIAKVRILTADDITVDKNGTFIGSESDKKKGKYVTDDMVKAAMKNFLSLKEKDIIQQLTESLQGNMREIIGTQTLKALCNDRKAFGDEVQDKAQKDMNALGIWVESCNIQKIEDENNLINALGQDNMSQIQKDASIAKAAADRDVAIAQADARKAANDAKVAADTEIAIKQNELEIKRAELRKQSDIKKAEADAAYDIQKQEQRKIIEIKTADANIAKQEKEIDLKDKEVTVQENVLKATIEKQADAEKYKIEKQAEADLFRRQKEAEAKKYEEQQAAEARKLKAEAEKYSQLQEAEAVKAKGLAEAEAIRAKGSAEAEALEKKAEAMRKYGEAAIVEMIVNKLPEMAEKVAQPLSTIDKVTIIDGGNGSGVNEIGSYVPTVLAKTLETVKETTGIDISEIAKANTYDAKVNRNVNISGDLDIPQISKSAPTEAPAEVLTEVPEEVEITTKSANKKASKKKR